MFSSFSRSKNRGKVFGLSGPELFKFHGHTFIPTQYGRSAITVESLISGKTPSQGYPSWMFNSNFFTTHSTTSRAFRWTVPTTGLYYIVAVGAPGAPCVASNSSSPFGTPQYPGGGRGAYMSGVFNLKRGEVLKIIVGQTPTHASARTFLSSPGGGGSFVSKYISSTVEELLIAAGGGGGIVAPTTGENTPNNPNANGLWPGLPYELPESCHGQISSVGGQAKKLNYQTSVWENYGGAGGANDGSGGAAGNANNGAGSGWNGNGAPNITDGGGEKTGPSGGCRGGSINSTYAPSGGGYGGGGSPTTGTFYRASGGGGYSGGGSSSAFATISDTSAIPFITGGGGGSFNTAQFQYNMNYYGISFNPTDGNYFPSPVAVPYGIVNIQKVLTMYTLGSPGYITYSVHLDFRSDSLGNGSNPKTAFGNFSGYSVKEVILYPSTNYLF